MEESVLKDIKEFERIKESTAKYVKEYSDHK